MSFNRILLTLLIVTATTNVTTASAIDITNATDNENTNKSKYSFEKLTHPVQNIPAKTIENNTNDKLYLTNFSPLGRRIITATAGTYVLDQKLGNRVVGYGAPHNRGEDEHEMCRENFTTKDYITIVGTNVALHYLGDKIEDHFHAKGYDLTQSIAQGCDDWHIAKADNIKPFVEVGVFVGKELTYALGTTVVVGILELLVQSNKNRTK